MPRHPSQASSTQFSIMPPNKQVDRIFGPEHARIVEISEWPKTSHLHRYTPKPSLSDQSWTITVRGFQRDQAEPWWCTTSKAEAVIDSCLLIRRFLESRPFEDRKDRFG